MHNIGGYDQKTHILGIFHTFEHVRLTGFWTFLECFKFFLKNVGPKGPKTCKILKVIAKKQIFEVLFIHLNLSGGPVFERFWIMSSSPWLTPDYAHPVKKQTGSVKTCKLYHHLWHFHILVTFVLNFPEKLLATGSETGHRVSRGVSRLTPVKLNPNGAKKYIIIFLSFRTLLFNIRRPVTWPVLVRSGPNLGSRRFVMPRWHPTKRSGNRWKVPVLENLCQIFTIPVFDFEYRLYYRSDWPEIWDHTVFWCPLSSLRVSQKKNFSTFGPVLEPAN
jgi:hypothetical protein